MRRYLADTMAMVLFSTCAGALIEIGISGLSVEQCARVRLGAIPVMLLAGRSYGAYRDWCLARWPGSLSNSAKVIVDTWANLTFQLALYAVLLTLNGAEIHQITRALGAAATVNLVGGRPYGVLLEGCRHLLNVAPR